MTEWDIAYYIASALQLAWVWSYCIRMILKLMNRDAPGVINRIFFEGRPVVPLLLLAAYLAGAIADGVDGMGWRIWNLAFGFWNWWTARNEKDDDDRWKRRRQAVADRVANVGHKLVVARAEQ